jgi:hypothetical protein
MSIALVAAIVEAVRKNQGFIVDDYAPCIAAYRPKHLGVVKTEEFGEVVVPIFEHQMFPMTMIELDHAGKPHMTRQKLKRIFDTRQVQVNDLAGCEPDLVLVIDV